MTDPDTLFSIPLLASSSDGGSLVIFIVIALITIVSKLIEWYKNKADNASDNKRMPTFDPETSSKKTMEEIIRKAIVEQQQKGKASPPVPGHSSRTVQPPRPQPATSSAKQTTIPRKSSEPAVSPMMESRPRPIETTYLPEPSIPEMTAPAPYVPTSFEDIGQSVTQLTDNIEKEARKAMDEAYSSAESSYKTTMDLLEQSAQKAREQAKIVIENSLPPINEPLDLRTPGLLKKAVIMSEILASPKGLK